MHPLSGREQTPQSAACTKQTLHDVRQRWVRAGPAGFLQAKALMLADLMREDLANKLRMYVSQTVEERELRGTAGPSNMQGHKKP